MPLLKGIMEFHEKLQQLRKRKGLTQEELAELLYVSRTAVSRWESGRGYPGIDSLKAIAALFSVTVDELLSGGELLSITEQAWKEKEDSIRDLVFGLLDISVALLLFLPLFAQKANGALETVSLLSLTEAAPYLRLVYFALVLGTVLTGILTLALQNCRCAVWLRSKRGLSFFASAAGTLIFILSTKPYAAALLFAFLAIKLLVTRNVSSM